MRRIGDIAAAVACLVVAAAAFLTANGFTPGAPGQPGPSFFPKVVCLFIGLLSLKLLWKGLRAGKEPEGAGAKPATPTRDYLRVVVVVLLSAVYLYGVEECGFLLATAVFSAICLFILGERRVSRLVGVSVFFPLLVFIAFKTLLSVPLPEGWLSF